MSALSPFQTLPPHVVKLIVDHVVGSSRLVYDGIRVYSDEYNALLAPLMWVCSNFRAVALPLYCNMFQMDLTPPLPDDLCVLDMARDDYLGHSTHHLATTLEIVVEDEAVCSGAALRLLSCAPYDGCSFPLVRKFMLTLSPDKLDRVDENAKTDSQTAEANIDALVQRIKQMAPRVSEIGVNQYGFDRPVAASRHVCDLILQLFQLVNRVELNCYLSSCMTLDLQLDKLCDLTHIKDNRQTSNSLIVQLARRNSQTLRSLSIQTEKIDVVGLIQATDGSLITYPQLLTLNLKEDWEPDPQPGPVFSGAVPFPSLKCLRICLPYPFGDATMFRGNAATLESLELELDNLSTGKLRRHSAFTPASHPKLRYINITLTDPISGGFRTATECMQFVLSIGSRAPVRIISGLSDYEDFSQVPSVLENHASIQYLSLFGARLSFWDAISLIKSLPLLSDLAKVTPYLGEPPQSLREDELPNYVRATYAPMGQRFRCWRITIYSYFTVSYAELATCMLLLALACPNFDYAAVNNSHRQKFMEAMKQKIGEPEFSQDAPRLERLLYHGWNYR
ncbi:hypothetical protein GGF42_004696 [Coemansia sp. RSA 2424]|nr:hypothetical protein GGF42_004696 [Coemansia sp. RSA 2424]